MAHVIKATQGRVATGNLAFHFDDMGREVASRVAQAKAEARRTVSEAQQEADELRRRAEAEGLAAAEAAIDERVAKAVSVRLDQELATACQALSAATSELAQARHAWLHHWEHKAVELAAAMARRVIRRELTKQPEITLDLVREALEMASGTGALRVHLHPHDLDALKPKLDTILEQFAHVAPAELVADSKISRGGCRVESQFGAIDQQFESQLARLAEELA